MFFRIKPSGGRRYLQIVENKRVDGKVRQVVRLTIGRMDELEASGQLARLLASGARHCEQMMLLSAIENEATMLSMRRFGAPLLFGRLWQESGIAAVLEELLAGRQFEFPVERAVFATVLHRIMVSGSDRACDKWLDDYDIPGTEELGLHHLYRAMAWLGEELLDEEQGDATPFAPRTVKDLVEERLFARRHDLFTDLSVVFMDTTSLYFEGAGGETLGARGHSKDYRPQLAQMILGVVIDQDGRPICTEMWPGNTADVSVLVPVIDRLRSRFGITRVCVVADRGMISAATIAALEERGLEYVLGARERTDRIVREVVLADERPYIPLCLERAGGNETQLFIKEVKVAGKRYIVCRNEVVAIEEAETRRQVVAALDRQLTRGDKALIGNSAYRRFLRPVSDAKPGRKSKLFEIDAGKLAEEARFDGVFVLRSNARISPLQAVLRYRDLQNVERLFRVAKATMRTRPIYHSSDAAIRGHVFCSFLALILHQALDEKLRRAGKRVEWADLLRDLDRLQHGEISQNGKRWQVRTEAGAAASAAFKAARIAMSPRLQTPQQAVA
ncbi:putative transposase for insertion sequence element (plasmid) [Acidiphilium multivorum AIU301]|uniref:Putative transposase for insertion sequence element n=1 Tax=Acidiphilium multivorum (strain DSM 11245 / JCM 8867 / NBRC 100883 / AIU 301) TaxID=926570 RepID=F0J749_ACIMA|nr:IS1634 family transposase [Acidiphilium multivorum]BAJ82916.1 putative transposase for insertion sequence element [Acidiphilium multivorum AIU301]